MKKYIPILKHTKLFSGVGEDEISAMLNCLQATAKNYKKGDFVFREGEHIHTLAILVKGALYVQKDDYWGNRSIVSMITLGEMFGEAYAAPNSGVLLNDVIAIEDSVVIFFDIRKILTICPSACRFHSMAVQNLFFSISEKNRTLMQKLGHMAQRTTREKLISYLSEEAQRQASSSFEIPFNRQQLADFLSVDRSAMSNELSKMRKEGLLTFEKNHFSLYYRNNEKV